MNKGRTFAVDTTVAPSNIFYPTDIRLLESARQFLLRVIRRYHRHPGQVRTHCRRARKTYLGYIKLKNIKRKVTRVVHGKMIRFVKRNLRQAMEAFEQHVQNIPEMTVKQIRTAQILDATSKMLEQQKEVRRRTPRNGNKRRISIPSRIVSIFREYVRPMPRGKIPVKTEFGPKVLFEMRSGFMSILQIAFENIADCEMLGEFFPRWQNYNLVGDRGFHSPVNTRLAREHGLKGYYVEKKGKRSLPKTRTVKRARSVRAAIESRISWLKRKYGLSRILYGRGEEGERQWIYLGVTAMNFELAFRKMAA